MTEIASSGKDMEHFASLIDLVLGTGIPDQDVEQDTAWENANRKA